MNKKLKFLAMPLILAMATSAFAACGGGNKDTTTPTDTGDEEDKFFEEYGAASKAIYDAQLGDFYTAYAAAKNVSDDSTRYAMMAIAEAKLLESAAMIPSSTKGGNYAISRVAPYTVDFALWGNDSDRFHQALIVKGNPIKSTERDEMKEKYSELKGTGTYEAWAKQYLADKGYELDTTYAWAYSSEPKTWDALATSRAADSEAIVNTYDGLYEYDIEGVARPAIATSYEVSDDGLTYTFTLRNDVQWVDSQKKPLGKVTADDFVAGFQHMLDAKGGLEWLVEELIVNAGAYIKGSVTDFSQVGVKAIADDKLQYTLTTPCSYFTTMLGYNIFAPLNRAFYVSKGGKFGSEYKACDYGTSPENIAYCGPYVVTGAANENNITFEAYESYYNYDKINIKNIIWRFNDGTDVLKAYNDMKKGDLSGAGLNASSLVNARADIAEGDKSWFDLYGYTSSTDATTFSFFFNLNRTQFVNVADGAAGSSMTAAARELSTKAMNNVHFRRAVAFAADRASYNAQTVGDELKYNSLRNSYTPGNFVSLTKEITVKINGTDTTYPVGTQYGKIMQDQLDADNVKITVWTDENVFNEYSSDGYDGWYNPENAKAELALAIADLEKNEVEFTRKNNVVTNKIQIDLPTFTGNANYYNRAMALKKSIEENLGEYVQVNLVGCATSAVWYNAGYYTDYGYEANYTVYDVSGWGPDYGDPSSYLDTMLPDFAGYMVKCFGIY